MDKEKLKGYLDNVKTALGKISKNIWIFVLELSYMNSGKAVGAGVIAQVGKMC